MTILITGASGNIGSALTQQLQSSGIAFETLRSKPDPQSASARIASYDDVAALTRAFEGIESLFLLLPLTQNKLQHAKNAAQAAKAAGVRHIVRSSGAGADPNAGFALPRLQGTVDAVLADTGIATTFLRPAGFLQNYATFMAEQVKSGTVYAAHADASQSLIDARDIASAALSVLRNPAAHSGKAYTLTGGESLTTQQVLDRISSEIGREVRYQPVPPEAAVKAMLDLGMPPWMVELMDSLNRVVSAGYASAISPDLPALIGRAPITVAQFAKDYRSGWL